MTRREALVAVALLGLTIATLWVLGGSVLWLRPLWFDELCCVTYVVSDAASPAEVVHRVARGWDYAPPLLHVIVWIAARATGGEVTPVLLRSISLAAVSGALLLVYGTLRRRFSALPSAAGVLAVAGHPVVVTHAFEARFYGPWLLLAAAYAWSLSIANPRRRAVAQAIVAALLVMIHWFGILSLALMSAAVFLLATGTTRAKLRVVAPSAAGVIALAALVPMAFFQRAGSTGLLWVDDLDATQVFEMARLYWLAAVPLVAALVLLAMHLRQRGARSASVGAVREPSIAALLALALMPVLLVGVSAALQPSMVDRYGIVAVLAWAPAVALAAAAFGRMVRVTALAALALFLLLAVRREIDQRREFTAAVSQMRAAFESAKSRQVPVVFWGLHAIYPVAGPERSSGTLARYLDLPDSTLLALFPAEAMAPVRKKYRLDRDQARGHARTYGFPPLATQSQLDSAPRFVLLADELSLPGGYKRPEVFARALFPRHRVTRLTERTSLFERDPR